MDLLESQASDLRAFLGQQPPAAASHVADVVSPQAVSVPAYSPDGPLPSSHSALGDNSAPQPASPRLEPRDGARTGAKRRADDGDGEAVAKQQRSKRNRVSD